MRILYIHQHFATPAGSTGTRSYEFARRWVKAGHKVTVITGYYDIGGLDKTKKLYRRLDIDGINVVVVGTRYSNKQSYIRRVTSFLFFCVLCIYAGLRAKKPDVIYATSTPLTVGIPAIVINRLKRIPFVFEVRDQWPEIPIELGIIKNKIMINLLLWMEKTIYKRAAAIVALSVGIADGIKKVLADKKSVSVIPNCCDLDVFRPDSNGSAVRRQYGWDNKLVLLYFGAIGKANGLDFIVNVAERLKGNPDIHFVLLGDGSEKPALIEKIKQTGLKNIEILDSHPKKELAEIVAACDISIVIFANYPILENNSANKFFDSLCAGRPVLLNYSGWQRKVLEDNSAGLGCDLCNMDQFVEKVLYLNKHREQLKQMGQNARKLAEEKFGRDRLAGLALSLLEERYRMKD